jgi:hypothetical protein
MGLSLARYGQDCVACQDAPSSGNREVKNRGAERAERGQTERVRPERLRASSQTSTSTSDLQFRVKTAEGDTVTLSINAVQQSTLDQASYRGSGGTLEAGQRTQQNSLSASLAVDGNLSEQELKDIQSVLTSLSQGKPVTELGTIESAQFSYTNTTTYSQGNFSYLG